MLKAVLDTNQFVSGIITKKGPSAQLLRAWQGHAYILITSKQIVKEVERVLHYPHLVQKYHLQEKDIGSLIHLIEHEAVVLPGSLRVNVVKEDPDDDKILACALEAKAQYIVSGDKHLLNLRRYEDIPIVTVREFLGVIGY